MPQHSMPQHNRDRDDRKGNRNGACEPVELIQDELICEEILVALRQIIREVDLRSRALFREFGLTAPQLICLKTISRLEPVSTSGLARAIHLGHPTVTGILNRLEKRGLILRQKCETDRRSVELRLTDSGRSVLDRAPSLLQDQFQSGLAKLAVWERTQMLATLQRIASMLGASGNDVAPLLAVEPADEQPEPALRAAGTAAPTAVEPADEQREPAAKSAGESHAGRSDVTADPEAGENGDHANPLGMAPG